MAYREDAVQSAHSAEKKTYFASDYSIGKRAKLELGSECYVIPLDIANGVIGAYYHDLKSKKNKEGKYIGFKGCRINSCKIKSDAYDEKNQPLNKEDSIANQLAQEEYEKFPSTEEASKRKIGFARKENYIPVLVLGNTETDPSKKLIDPAKLTLETRDFAFLTLPASTWGEIFTSYGEFLKKVPNGEFDEKGKKKYIIDYSLEKEELDAAIKKELTNFILKIKCIPAKSTSFKYSKSYEFIHLSDTDYALDSDDNGRQHKMIKNIHNPAMLAKCTKLNNDITDFLTLFNSEVDNLLTTWTPEELVKYVRGDSEDNRMKEKVEQFKKESDKEDMSSPENELDEFESELIKAESEDSEYTDTTNSVDSLSDDDFADDFDEEAFDDTEFEDNKKSQLKEGPKMTTEESMLSDEDFDLDDDDFSDLD